MGPGDKKIRNMMTMQLKHDIIEKHSRGARVKDLAKEFGKSTSTICTILKQKEAIKTVKPAIGITVISKQRSSLHDDMERLLLLWIKEREISGDRATEAMICEMALAIYEDLKREKARRGGSSQEPPVEDFKASRGWFNRFKKRTGIYTKHGGVKSSNLKDRGYSVLTENLHDDIIFNEEYIESVESNEELGLNGMYLTEEELDELDIVIKEEIIDSSDQIDKENPAQKRSIDEISFQEKEEPEAKRKSARIDNKARNEHELPPVANFNFKERLLLIDLFRERKSSLLDERFDTSSLLAKKQAWEEITSGINAAKLGPEKTGKQVKKMWDNMRTRLKQVVAKKHEEDMLSRSSSSQESQGYYFTDKVLLATSEILFPTQHGLDAYNPSEDPLHTQWEEVPPQNLTDSGSSTPPSPSADHMDIPSTATPSIARPPTTGVMRSRSCKFSRASLDSHVEQSEMQNIEHELITKVHNRKLELLNARIKALEHEDKRREELNREEDKRREELHREEDKRREELRREEDKRREELQRAEDKRREELQRAEDKRREELHRAELRKFERELQILEEIKEARLKEIEVQDGKQDLLGLLQTVLEQLKLAASPLSSTAEKLKNGDLPSHHS